MTNNLVLTEQDYLNSSPKVTYNPVFIMGDHRSGTTLLYKILSSTKMFNYITAYDVIEYDKLLSNHERDQEILIRQKIDKSLSENGIKDRGIDDVLVNSELPEEYGFILGNNSDSKKIIDNNINLLQEICTKIQLIQGNKDYILLKNPNDFTNLNFIYKNIPNAKFIIILRDAKDIARSRRKAYSHLFKQFSYYTSLLSKEYEDYYNNKLMRIGLRLYFSRFNLFTRNKIYKNTKNTQLEFLESLDKIDKSIYILTSYESICTQTNTEIRNIFQFLNIDFDKNLNLENFIRYK